ncbi:hypothetical protein AZE42_12511 [Rhizopogon vesiculosus]|uniref:Uncharacterized protein n=1 Tax=Rhizopogon vesiculosus TaxID=180088 RepID=A0A1J8RG18_9AGAM|nr:hypothetical protein AZE42_12511 [Rhizopogon vesiculosus]
MKGKAKMRPGTTKNGQNLCALRWLKRTRPGGTTDEFSKYFDTVLTSDQHEKYKEAKNLVQCISRRQVLLRVQTYWQNMNIFIATVNSHPCQTPLGHISRG